MEPAQYDPHGVSGLGLLGGLVALAAVITPPLWSCFDERAWISGEYRRRAGLPSPRDYADAGKLGVRFGTTPAGVLEVHLDPWNSGWRVDVRSGLPYSTGRNRIDEHGMGDDLVVYPLFATPFILWSRVRGFLAILSITFLGAAVLPLWVRKARYRLIGALTLGTTIALTVFFNWPVGLALPTVR